MFTLLDEITGPSTTNGAAARSTEPMQYGPEWDPDFGTANQNGGDNVWAPGYGTGQSQGDDNPFQPTDNTAYENNGDNAWAPSSYDDPSFGWF